MKRKDLIKIIEDSGCVLIRRGGKHDIYHNPKTGNTQPIPRHTEINERMSYDHFEHRHRFAMWAGARAAQRGFASSEILCGAIEATSVRKFLRDPVSLDIDAKGFESKHREWCNSVVKYLSERGVEGVTFGRAAKLLAVYLKAMVVVGESPQSRLAAVTHPPIDRILLQSLAASTAIDAPHRVRVRWRSVAWTKLTEGEFYSLIAELRTVLADSDPWWKLEEYWTVVGD